MSGPTSLAGLKKSLRTFLNTDKDGGRRSQGCCWIEISEKTARRKRHKGVVEVNDALAKLLSYEDSDGEAGMLEIPECIFKRAPCDRHHEACRRFKKKSRDKRAHDHPMKPSSRKSKEFRDTPKPKTTADQVEIRCQRRESSEWHDDNNNNVDYDCSKPNTHFGKDTPSTPRIRRAIATHVEELLRQDSASRNRKSPISPRVEGSKDTADLFANLTVSNTTADTTADESETSTSRGSPQLESVVPLHSTKLLSTPKRLGRAPVTPARRTTPPATPHDRETLKRFLVNTIRKNPNPSPRSLQAAKTIERYAKKDLDVADNAMEVIRRIAAPLTVASRRAGFVYAFRDPELPFVKIGSAKYLHTRKGQLEDKCEIIAGLTIVAQVKVVAYRRLEQIIHQDLMPHQWSFDCKHGRPEIQEDEDYGESQPSLTDEADGEESAGNGSIVWDDRCSYGRSEANSSEDEGTRYAQSHPRDNLSRKNCNKVNAYEGSEFTGTVDEESGDEGSEYSATETEEDEESNEMNADDDTRRSHAYEEYSSQDEEYTEAERSGSDQADEIDGGEDESEDGSDGDYEDCEDEEEVKQKFIKHHEYFSIDDKTAKRTLDFWGDFVNSNPWGRLSPKKPAKLLEKWTEILTAPPIVDISETHGDHHLRERRWRALLEMVQTEVDDASEKLAGPPDVSEAVRTWLNNLPRTTKVSPRDATPSKSRRRSARLPQEKASREKAAVRPVQDTLTLLSRSRKSLSSEDDRPRRERAHKGGSSGLKSELPHRYGGHRKTNLNARFRAARTPESESLD